MTDKFHQSLNDPDQFTLTYELVPGRGGRSVSHSRALALAEEASADGRLQAVSITENAGGHPVLSPEVLGIEIKKMGLDVIIHLSCKDRNRHQIESTLFAWDREDLDNLLVISGDYPQKGYRGRAKPVFDLDSIHVLDLISRLNCEQNGRDRRNPAVQLYHPTTFYKGVAVSPFKHLEAELMMQYYKLHRKVENGADYVITQIGYDARKFHELLLYMEMEDIGVPILGNVFIPNLKVAELMYRGEIPGCVIPDRLYEEMQAEARSADKGKEARLIRGAKLLSVLQGMGYSGAHIGGPGLTYKDISFMLDQAERYRQDWRELVKELSYWPEKSFHLFEKDQSGLNSRTYNTRSQAKRKKLSYSFSKIN
ncbi:MAG: methylenetetrahydrofolate reductase, partial [Desulfurivibrionaceae bacterium]